MLFIIILILIISYFIFKSLNFKKSFKENLFGIYLLALLLSFLFSILGFAVDDSVAGFFIFIFIILVFLGFIKTLLTILSSFFSFFPSRYVKKKDNNVHATNDFHDNTKFYSTHENTEFNSKIETQSKKENFEENLINKNFNEKKLKEMWNQLNNQKIKK